MLLWAKFHVHMQLSRSRNLTYSFPFSYFTILTYSLPFSDFTRLAKLVFATIKLNNCEICLPEREQPLSTWPLTTHMTTHAEESKLTFREIQRFSFRTRNWCRSALCRATTFIFCPHENTVIFVYCHEWWIKYNSRIKVNVSVNIPIQLKTDYSDFCIIIKQLPKFIMSDYYCS